MLAFCDFDGTIATEDVTDLVLDRFALPAWREIEARWEEGVLNTSECMRTQIRLIQAELGEIDAFLERVDIDPGFLDFKRFCDRAGIEIVIVSDGVDHFIHRVLAQHGISGVQIVASHLVTMKDGFDLDFPYGRPDCRVSAGVCKCALLEWNTPHIFIGDGRSDFCAARRANMVFAKGKLAAFCRRESIPHAVYSDFHDVLDMAFSLTGAPLPSFQSPRFSQQP